MMEMILTDVIVEEPDKVLRSWKKDQEDIQFYLNSKQVLVKRYNDLASGVDEHTIEQQIKKT